MKHCKSLICQKTVSQVMCQNALGQSDCRILKCNLKKEVRDQVDFLYVNRHPSFLQGDTVLAWVVSYA